MNVDRIGGFQAWEAPAVIVPLAETAQEHPVKPYSCAHNTRIPVDPGWRWVNDGQEHTTSVALAHLDLPLYAPGRPIKYLLRAWSIQSQSYIEAQLLRIL